MNRLEELVDSGNGVGVRVYGNNVDAALKKLKRTLDKSGKTKEMIKLFWMGAFRAERCTMD